MRRTATAAIKAPADLRDRIAILSARSPATERFSTAWKRRPGGGQREQEHPWYSNQHEHWLGYLDGFVGPGAYGRKNSKRSAEFVYGYIVNPLMLIYLAEAAGLGPAVVRAAVKDALRAFTMPAMCAAIRRVVPWETVEAALLRHR
jgi:hypothetical protein